MDVRERVLAARASALVLAAKTGAERARALVHMADALEAALDDLREANAADVRDAEAAAAEAHRGGALLDRLRLTPGKAADMVRGVRDLAAMPDPVGRTVEARRLDDGLDLYRVTAPLGVVAAVFEARPDAFVQIAALAVRTGNAVLLKGGSEARQTNEALADVVGSALQEAAMPLHQVQLLASRDEVGELLAMDDLVDLVVPRGSYAFVRDVRARTRIPVLGHADGVCHIYVDAAADAGKALRVILDAKTDYPAACNAVECVLVHEAVHRAFLPRIVEALAKAGVSVRGCPRTQAVAPGVEAASEEDWGREYGDLVIAVKVVDDLEDAVAHINRYGSKHTDAIVTDDGVAAQRFVAAVDTADCFVNASTRFSDGYRFGLGAELGIATGKLHARGPVGAEGLLTTKWVLLGDGHTAGPYQGEKARPFKHEAIEATLDEAWGRDLG